MTKQEILDKFNDIDFVYNDSSKHETLSRMLDELLKEQEPVKPVRVSISPSDYDFIGKNGILKVGSCPVCGQGHINNGDNKFCGGCGRPVDWS